MANPVLSQIVSMSSATIPNVGLLSNYDNILGTDGIVGIKTGNSNQAGGVFLGAADTKVNGQTVTVLTAVMGAPLLTTALNDTVPLVVSMENDFSQTILISKGEVLGEFREPWGGVIEAGAGNNLSIYLLQGQNAKADLSIKPLRVPSPPGTAVGSITTVATPLNSSVSVPIVTVEPTTSPSWYWRLLHPSDVI
jgi:D-alanyl-D-alanine carboxypeptidase (penicillin-binding protein 5/6)